MADKQIVYTSGVLADTGDYGYSIEVDALFEMILAERGVKNEDEQFFVETQTEGREQKTLGPPKFIDDQNLAQARWGILWPPEPLTDAEQKHRDALQALIAHRQTKAGGGAPKPREFFYQPGWTYDQFLWDAGPGVETGSMQPDKVPYYLLIVGPPNRIPWEFQYYLDGEYAVGRLWFDDPADCGRYVERLVAYETETGPLPTSRQALLVGPHHPGDKATTSSATSLVTPLRDFLVAQKPLLNVDPLLLVGKDTGGGAFKTKLLQLLQPPAAGGAPSRPPALLFTAGHGVEYDKPSDEQFVTQGAPLFQEWPGPGNPPSPAQYLGPDDVTAGLSVAGMVNFSFACFSAGTPQKQDWVWPTVLIKPKEIAVQPFVARLPQKLLAHGALGFIGHVSKAWEYSILGVNLESEQIVPFKDTLMELLRGRRVGHATDSLNGQWAKLTVLLDQRLQDAKKFGKERIIATWMARNDFRNYVLLGDPAARLRVDALV